MADQQLLALKAVAVWLAHPATAFPADVAHQVLDAIEATKEPARCNDCRGILDTPTRCNDCAEEALKIKQQAP